MRLEKNLIHIAILCALWSAIYLGTIQQPALLDDADSFHAEAVREMVVSGDWITLRIDNGVRYLEKAPLMYWLSALSVTVFGLHEWAIRLPVAFFALFLTLLIYRFGSRYWGEKGGFYSALVFVTALGPYAFTRIFLPDVLVSFFMTFAFYCYLQIALDTDPKPRRVGPVDLRCAGLYAAVALGVLSKGLIGVIFVGAVIFAHMLATWSWSTLRRLQIGYGILIFLMIAAPWHLAAGFANEHFFWFYFIREHLLRYLGMRYPKDYDTVPLLAFWALHLAWLFPWSAFLWGFGKILPRSLRPQGETARVTFFLFLWIFVILLFFAFSTTQEYYTFPTLAAFSLLLGRVLAELTVAPKPGESRWAVVSLGIAALVAGAAGTGMIALAWMGSHSADAASLAGTLTVNPEHYNLSFGHLYDLTPGTFAHLSRLVYRTAFFLIAGPLIAFVFALLRRWTPAFLVLGVMMAGICHSYNAGMVAFEPVLSSKGLAKVIEYHHRPGDMIVINDFYEKGSTLNFYTGLQVHVLNGEFGVLWWGTKHYEDAPKVFLDESAFEDLWKSSRRIFFFSEKEPLEDFLKKHPGLTYRELAGDGGKKVLINW